MQPSNKIAIIGAGIGGLASGYFLQEAGRDVEVFERAKVPGGRIQLLEKDGARVDVGTQYFHTNYVETLKLLEAVGLKDQLRSIRPPVEMMRGGKGYLVRHNTIRYRAIPLASNLRFAKMIWTALANFGKLNPYFNQPMGRFEDIELAQYTLEKCDREVLEFLVRPIITAFNMSDPEGESLAHFLTVIKQFLTSSDTCLPGGMFSFPKALASKLPVTYNAPTQKILTESGRVKGLEVRVGGETRTILADRLICATPLKELAKLLPHLSEEEKAVIRDFRYSQHVLAIFFMNRRISEEKWAYVFSRTENYKTSFTSDASFKCAEMVPSGNSVLQAWFAGEAGEELIDADDEAIVALARKEMAGVIPGFADAIDSVEVVRHHTGMSRFRVGIYPRLRRFLEGMTRFQGLHLVGDYYGHSTLETVVRSARRAVDKIISPP